MRHMIVIINRMQVILEYLTFHSSLFWFKINNPMFQHTRQGHVMNALVRGQRQYPISNVESF